MAAFYPIDGERWLPVADRNGYEVSDLGRVRSWIKGGCKPGVSLTPKIVVPFFAGKGYLMVSLWANNKGIKYYVHRLVMEAFVGLCQSGMECRHLNGNRTDNRLENLKWGTKDDNTKDRLDHGTLTTRREHPEVVPFMFYDSFTPIESIIPREIWKSVRDFPAYQASNLGGIRSLYVRGHTIIGTKWNLLRGMTNPKYGHKTVLLRDEITKVARSFARVILETFSPQVHANSECRHIDGNSSNNHISNLRWGTHLENMRDRTLHGTDNRGERCGNSKLTEADVRDIRDRRAAGERPCEIEKDYPQVSQATISAICNKGSWRHIE